KDAASLSAEAQANWRRQALQWLRADLAHWAGHLRGAAPGPRQAAVETLRRWLRDPNLAGVRDERALGRLPPAEREAWRSLWSELGQALSRGEASPGHNTK